MDIPLFRKKIDVLYDDIIGDVKDLVDRQEANKTVYAELDSRMHDTLGKFKDEMQIVAKDIVAQTALLNESSKIAIHEAAKSEMLASARQIHAAVADAVTHGARQAALKVLTEPMDEIQRTYREISERIIKFKDLAEQIQKKLIVTWWKVLMIAVLFLILGGSASIFIGRTLEARYPAFSDSELSVLRAGNRILATWDLLDKKSQDLIINGED
jgi:hypothetical protein